MPGKSSFSSIKDVSSSLFASSSSWLFFDVLSSSLLSSLSPPPPPKQTKEERTKIEQEALENDYRPVPPKGQQHLMPEGVIHTLEIDGRLRKVKRVGKKLVEVVDK